MKSTVALYGRWKMGATWFGIVSCELKYSDLEKEMATHSSILAWESPWTEEPGGLKSMGLRD